MVLEEVWILDIGMVLNKTPSYIQDEWYSQHFAINNNGFVAIDGETWNWGVIYS